MQAKVLIAGGSGFIGNKLGKLLLDKGYQVAILTRNKHKESIFEEFTWNINSKHIQSDALKNVDYVINLAGTNIAEGRWTKKRRQDILDSRIKSTELLFEHTQKLQIKPKAFIAASAVGYYGNADNDKTYDEQEMAGVDFLAKVCQKWEEASLKFQKAKIRTVILRTGVVLDKQGGAFPKMVQSLKFGFISSIGSGKQYIPWIHLNDLLNIYLNAIEHENIIGIYNAVAPHQITQNDFAQEIKTVSQKIKFPNLPAFVLKILYGEMSSILLKGNKISAKKILETGFSFKYNHISAALKELLRK